MILSNMTPQEKLAQGERVLPKILCYGMGQAQRMAKVLRRAARFPFVMILPEKEFDGYGKWSVIFTVKSKKYIKEGYIVVHAYQTFYVSSKNPMNSGTGIYMICPNVRYGTWLYEFPPHFFSRYRERYIKPKGIAQPDFKVLLREIFRMLENSMNVIIKGSLVKGDDGLYDVVKTPEYERQKGYDNFICYMPDGVCYGVHSNNYYHFTTFVDNSLLRDGQRKFQRKMLDDLKAYEFTQRNRPNKRFYEECTTNNTDF